MMRMWFTSVALAALVAAPAIAADMPVKARPVAPPAQFDWSGCYLGGHVGWKSAHTSGSVNVAPAAGPPAATGASSFPLIADDSSSVVGGGQVGCNMQSGQFVYGIEGDVGAHDWNASRIVGAGAVPVFFVPGDVFDVSSRWQASLRGRIGYAWDRTLLYATGGVAFTRVRTAANFIAFGGFPATVATESDTLVGGTVGGGLEYAFNTNWSAGIEGRYTWYGNHTFNSGALATFGFPPGGPFTFAATTQTLKFDTAEVVAKLNYRFNTFGAGRP
jgi:outer membrane immunogenic protein